MRLKFLSLALFLYCCSLFTNVLSKPTPIIKPRANRIRQEPDAAQSTACGDIIREVNNGFAYFYATDAYDCLTSVPFVPAVALRFVDYINTTVQFQSTLAYLKDPPVGYQQPAVDFLGELQKIKTNVTTGVYKNQYQFETDIQYLIYKAHDSHLYLTAGIYAAFTFLAPYSITAASADGKSLPKVYITNDVIQSRNQSWTPSPITTINGVDAIEYLKKLAGLNSFGGIEPHADWNQLFSTPTLSINGEYSVWDGNVNFYPGDKIEIVVENGTEYLDYWQALYNEPYQTGPLTTGGDFYNYFVLGLLPASYNKSAGIYNPAYQSDGSADSNSTTVSQNSWSSFTEGAYPDPDVAQNGLAVVEDGVVSGYFLRDVDAAVLSIPSFGQSGDAIGNFSLAVSQFIGNVTKENLTRVVIDLQQNTGGTVELAFSTFRRFFPGVNPFAGSRRRIHQLADTFGQSYTTFFNSISTGDPSYLDYLADEWVVTPRLNAATGKNFSSWPEFRGPVSTRGDSFSLIERFNLSSYDFAAALFEGWIPVGYTPEEPFDSDYEQPFEAKNMVVLTDGACASTCALMVEMFTQAGVKTVVAGGLPISGPMQAVGGTRGAALYSADDLDADIRQVILLNNIDAILPELPDNLHRDSGVFTTVLGVNLRDQMRPSETDPLQFKYEAADCRIFYTLANVYNMTRLWHDVVTAAFDDRSLCVEGSTGYANSSKPAPKPMISVSPPLNIDFDGADKPIIADGLDLSGGLQAELKSIRSNDITFCDSLGECEGASECIKVDLSKCGDSPRKTTKVERCVPITKSKKDCPAGTTWTIETTKSLKGFSSPDRVGKLAKSSKSYGTGPCRPEPANKEYCLRA